MPHLVRRISRFLRTLAWHAGGHSTRSVAGIKVPIRGCISEEANLVFPEKIELGSGVLLLQGATLICAEFPPYVEPSGSIAIGEDTVVREGAIIQSFGGKIRIGRSCTINAYCVIQGNGGVTIGDNVLIAAHVCMFSANHIFSDADRPIRTQGETRRGIVIHDDVWIGAGVKILDGVEIGHGAVIAAGAVVNRNVPPFEVHAGVPARRVSMRKKP